MLGVRRTRRSLISIAAGAIGGVAVAAAAPEAALAQGPESVFDVRRDYGARADGRTDDTAAIRRALSDAAVNGGAVLFGPGTYVVSEQLTYSPRTRWIGAARGATVLSLTRELSTGGPTAAAFIVPSGGGAFPVGEEWAIEHLTVDGPGHYALGRSGSHTSGVVLNSKARMSDVFVRHFFAGVEIQADHQIVEDSKLSNNFYGISFPDSMLGWGNQSFHNLDLTGAAFASVHIGGAGNWDSSIATNVHMGFSPVGILKTDHQDGWGPDGTPTYRGPPATRGGVTGSDFQGVYFESVGNGAIIDISRGADASLYFTKWRSVGHSWGSSYKVTGPPLDNPAYHQAWAVMLRGAVGSQIDGGEAAFQPGSTGVFNVTGPVGGSLELVMAEAPPPTLVGSGSDWGPAQDGTISLVIRGNAAGLSGIASVWASDDTIAPGDLLEIAPSGALAVRRASGAAPVLGVALTPSVAGGAVAVQTDGVAVVSCAGRDQIIAGAALSLSPTEPHLADRSEHAPGMPRVGVATKSGANPTRSLEGVLLRL